MQLQKSRLSLKTQEVDGSGKVMKHMAFGPRHLRLNPILAFSKCVTVGKLLCISEPQFSHLWNGANIYRISVH